MSTPTANPYRALCDFALRVYEDEKELFDKQGGQPQGPEAWGPCFREREAELNALVKAGLVAADRTGFSVQEVERRLKALTEAVFGLLLWQRDAPRFTADEIAEERERYAGFVAWQPKTGPYLVEHRAKVLALWSDVETLAIRLEARPVTLAKYSDPSRCPGCNQPTPPAIAALAELAEGKISDAMIETVYPLPVGTSHSRTLVCANCRRWELHTGLSFMPCAGPGPMQCVALCGAHWRSVPAEETDSATKNEPPPARMPGTFELCSVFADEEAKALSSAESFRDYLSKTYEAGDICAEPEALIVNWRGIVEHCWEMARKLGGRRCPPPPLPVIDSEPMAKSGIDQLLKWSYSLQSPATPPPPPKKGVPLPPEIFATAEAHYAWLGSLATSNTAVHSLIYGHFLPKDTAEQPATAGQALTPAPSDSPTEATLMDESATNEKCLTCGTGVPPYETEICNECHGYVFRRNPWPFNSKIHTAFRGRDTVGIEDVNYAAILALADSLPAEAARLASWTQDGSLDETGASLILKIAEQWLAVETTLEANGLAGRPYCWIADNWSGNLLAAQCFHDLANSIRKKTPWLHYVGICNTDFICLVPDACLGMPHSVFAKRITVAVEMLRGVVGSLQANANGGHDTIAEYLRELTEQCLRIGKPFGKGGKREKTNVSTLPSLPQLQDGLENSNRMFVQAVARAPTLPDQTQRQWTERLRSTQVAHITVLRATRTALETGDAEEIDDYLPFHIEALQVLESEITRIDGRPSAKIELPAGVPAPARQPPPADSRATPAVSKSGELILTALHPSAIHTEKAAQPSGNDAATIRYLGEKAYSIGSSSPITVTDPEDAVLQAFLPLASMDGPTLGEKSGYGDRAPKILRELSKKRSGLFAAAIRLPGGKSGGGYHVAIRKA